MRAPSSALVALLLAPALAACLAPTPAADLPIDRRIPLAPGPFESQNATFPSFDGVSIAYTAFKPVGAGPDHRVPVILQTHGWGSRRSSEAGNIGRPFLEAGFGFVSMDMRGAGDSGGLNGVMDPEGEVRDVLLLIDLIAGWDWVLLDGPGDPVLGGAGISYGGGMQWLTALEETRLTGRTRFNAIAPAVTWNALTESLGPNGVPKTWWIHALLGTAVAAGYDLDPRLAPWVAEGDATGEFPPEATEFLWQRSPARYVEEGYRLDIPVFLGQGSPDTLFPLQEAWRNYLDVLTPEAQAKSLFVSHRNGHSIPAYQTLEAAPPEASAACAAGRCTTIFDNPCLETPVWLAVAHQVLWYRVHLAGETLDLGDPVQLATHEGECLRMGRLPDGTGSTDAAPATPGGTPVPLVDGGRAELRLADGPLVLAGIPALDATVSTLHPDAHLFFALAVGTGSGDLRIAGDQWAPWRGAGGDLRGFELPALVERVPEGAAVYLVVAGSSELYAGHGNRIPGTAVLADVRVALPVFEAER